MQIGDGLSAPSEVIVRENHRAHFAIHLDAGHDAAQGHRIIFGDQAGQFDEGVAQNGAEGAVLKFAHDAQLQVVLGARVAARPAPGFPLAVIPHLCQFYTALGGAIDEAVLLVNAPRPPACQRAAERSGRSLVKEDFHPPSGVLGDDEALVGEFQDSVHLLPGHSGKPLQELADGRAAFEIFEERPHWDTRAAKQPRPPDLAGHAFNFRALTPIKHGLSLRPARVKADGRTAG